jgi:hypothetical protein
VQERARIHGPAIQVFTERERFLRGDRHTLPERRVDAAAGIPHGDDPGRPPRERAIATPELEREGVIARFAQGLGTVEDAGEVGSQECGRICAKTRQIHGRLVPVVTLES